MSFVTAEKSLTWVLFRIACTGRHSVDMPEATTPAMSPHGAGNSPTRRWPGAAAGCLATEPAGLLGCKKGHLKPRTNLVEPQATLALGRLPPGRRPPLPFRSRLPPHRRQPG